uniref:Uncharacterized protein n=1 Tax=Arundo donax TaxID=35708 RepID=A0A0A9BEF2_ARUDO
MLSQTSQALAKLLLKLLCPTLQFHTEREREREREIAV